MSDRSLVTTAAEDSGGGRVSPLLPAQYRDTANGGPEYSGLIRAVRDLMDSVVLVHAPSEVLLEATRRTEALSAMLEPYEVGSPRASAGRRGDLPGRGNPFLLPFVEVERTPDRVRGRVTFRPVHHGGGGAAHGGAQPLLFDEIMGILALTDDRPACRTAYMNVNYHRLTPLGKELVADATIDRQEGRKLWASSRLWDDESLLADAEALFVQVRPSQE